MSDDFLADLFDLGGDEIIHTDRTAYERAPFSMPGSKNASLKHILPKLPRRGKWVEHFGGSGVVSWNVPETKLMVYNDRYGGVVSFYRCLQSKRHMELIQRLEHLTPPSSREEWLHARATWCNERDDVERAAKWFYMVRNSVIGKGKAYARSTNSPPPIVLPNSLKLFEPLHLKLQNFLIENLDWRVSARDFDSIDCVHYFDPPYVDTDPGLYEHKWSRDDLADLLRTIGKLKGFVALSGYDDPQINQCSFWTERIDWNVVITSDVKAFTDENYKVDNNSGYEVGTEVLWIKEANSV